MSDCDDNAGIRYLVVPELIEINKEMLRLTPGEPFGVMDQGLLESAQSRPCVYRFYEQTEDIFVLAAVLGSGLVKNHPFRNANKRTAADAVHRFLILNGWECTAPEDDCVAMYLAIANHQHSDEEFADWLAHWSREYDTSKLND